jgi:hypothetical protein
MTKDINTGDLLPDVHGMLCFSLYSAGHAFYAALSSNAR